MTMLRTLFAISAIALCASPAFATEPAHAPAAGNADSHGEADSHGAADSHGGGHYYTTDDDGDGTANWMDSDSELFVVKDIGFHAFNLLCLVGLIGWYARKPLADSVRERALGIRKELTETARTRDEAYQRHQELVARLDRIEGEISTMESDATASAAKEEAKLIERAHAEALRIGETAERNIRDEGQRARNALRREAIELATKLAEGILTQSVTASDQQALARDFLDSLDSNQPSA